MSLELLIGLAALLLAAAGIALQVFHLKKDPNVPEFSSSTDETRETWTR